MFSEGPICLGKVSLNAKRPMQEVYRIVIFLLKNRLVRMMKTNFVLRLPSKFKDIQQLQIITLNKFFPEIVTQQMTTKLANSSV